MKSLGRKPSSSSDGPEVAKPSDEMYYPSFHLDGRDVKGTGLEKKAFGDECEVTLKVRVKRIGGYGSEKETPDLEFDVLAIGYEKEDEEEETESKVGVQLQKSKKRTVSASEAKLY